MTTASDIARLHASNLDFAVSRTGQDLTLGSITGKAIVSSAELGRKVDDEGIFKTVSIGATLPVTTFAVQPLAGQTFTTQGSTYRVLSVVRSYCGHAWGILAEHLAGG